MLPMAGCVGSTGPDRTRPLKAALPDAATRIERVDVDVLGWWRLLQEGGQVEAHGAHREIGAGRTTIRPALSR